MPLDFNITKHFKSGKKFYRPKYENENDYRRIVLLHSIGAFLIAPIFTYSMYKAEAPPIYINIGLLYTLLFPIYAVICGVVEFLNDKLIYFIYFQVYSSILLAYLSLYNSGFENQEFFYFFAAYAIASAVIVRLYPAVLYHVLVILLLLIGQDQIINTGFSPYIVIGAFLVIGIVSSFVLYARRQLQIAVEDYYDYLKRIMNNPGSGYILFDISDDPWVIDYNNEAIRVLNLKFDTIEAVRGELFHVLSKDDIDKIRKLKIGNTYRKQYSFTKYNALYYVELKISILPLKNNVHWIANISNVTEQVLKREELELKEKRYRNLYFRNKAGVFTINRNSEIIEGNDSFFKMLDGTLNKGDLLFGLDNQQDWELIMDTLRVSESLQNYQTQFRLTTGVNKTFIFSWYVDEQTNFIEGSVIDLTNIEKASQALKQSEEKYRLIYEESNDAILLLDGDRIVDANKSAEEMFGMTEMQLMHSNLFELSSDKGINSEKRYQEERAKLSKSRNIRFIWRFKGVNDVIEAEVSLIEIMIGSKLYYQCVIHDQTEQNKLAKEKLRAELAEETNIKLEAEIKERINAERKLQEQFLRTRAIFESSSNTLLLTLSLSGEITSYNSHCQNYFQQAFGIQITTGNIFIDQINEILSDRRKRLFNYLIARVKRGSSRQFEVKLSSTEAGAHWVEIFINPIFDTEGKVAEISMVAHDVSEKKKSSLEIEESLKEKEVLLKEIHHRVKNNLQVISSILNLQSSFVTDENTLGILQESRNRIRSMAIIHENLYRTEDFSSIKFANYLKNLTSNLIASYRINSDIELKLNLDDIDLILDQAIPCGLLINELITNALKYAWKDGESGTITINLKQEDKIVELEIGDDGIGLPDEFDMIKSDTLGLQLVITLAEQLDADLRVDVINGTKYLIKFENIKPRSHVQD